MSHEKSPKYIPRFARLPPATLERLQRSREAAMSTVLTKDATGSGPAGRVRRAPRPEMEVHTSLRFVPMKKSTAQKLEARDDPRSRRRPAEASKISPKEIEALQKAEPRLLSWIAKSNENAVLFTADPLKALGEAGVELEPERLRRLRLLRHRNLAAAGPEEPGVITKIKVSVGAS